MLKRTRNNPIVNIFKIKELRERIIFTLLLLVIYRFGAHITLPGLDNEAIRQIFEDLTKNTAVGFVDMFSGGAFSKMAIFALGIQPYISASIIMQLLTVVIPQLEELSKDPLGQKKIKQYTRYGTVGLAAIQGLGVSFLLTNPQALSSLFPGGQVRPLVYPGIPTVWFHFITVVTLAAGTSFVMWLGEQITERGIGNGISLIITVGIVSRLPSGVSSLIAAMTQTEQLLTLPGLVLFLALIIVAVMSTVFIIQSIRKVPVQYAKRVVGRKMYGGQKTHIPLRVNSAGMIPIIFATVLMSFPTTILRFIPQLQVAVAFIMQAWIYYPTYALLIIFFTYFYTAVVINPIQMAENLQKWGGFIPGIRPGKQTAQYLEKTLDRITLPGALFLAAIAVIPALFQRRLGVSAGISGASVLIVVGVMLDTMSQIESHLTTRHYEGFLKKTKMKGRR